MKKSALFCILIILFGLGGFPQTHISGVISNNTTWNIPGSPYIIDGNTEIQPGIKLIIEAGVVVKFSNNTTLLIDGELDAIGDFSNHIIITGYSNNLRQRILDHKNGRVFTTKNFLPITLVCYLAFTSKINALNFEKYLKTNSGFAFRNKHLI